MIHNHGPTCGHLVIHHFCEGGKNHVGFVEDDGSLSCFVPLSPLECTPQTCLMECTAIFQRLFESNCQARIFPEDQKSYKKGGMSLLKCQEETSSVLVRHDKHVDHLFQKSENEYSFHHNEQQGHCSERGRFLIDDALVHCGQPRIQKDVCSESCCLDSMEEPEALQVELPYFCTRTWRDLLHPASCRDLDEVDETVESVLLVDGMCCPSEVVLLKNVLGGVNGVKEIKANVILKRVAVVHTRAVNCETIADLLNQKKLSASIIRDGFSRDTLKEHIVSIKEIGDSKGRKSWNRYVSRLPPWHICLALLCWLVSLLHYIEEPEYLVYFKYVALVSVVLCAPVIMMRSFGRIRDCSSILDINSLMLLAVTGAIALGDYSEAAAVVSLFGVSGWLESTATRKVRDAMQDLFALKPEDAVLAGGNDSSLGSPGDRLLVANVPVGTILSIGDGDKIPLDGRVEKGETTVDESALTGESYPVKKSAGDDVLAGTLNCGGNYIEIVTSALSTDTTVSRMIRLIEEASQARSPREQLVERIARIYTPIVFVAAILLASIPWAWGSKIGQSYTEIALVLLVVACPCAFVISTPITYVCGLAHAAKCGLLVKGGSHLESLGQLKSLCVDKTGTLTEGNFRVLETIIMSDVVAPRVLFEWLYCAESGSSHPLAGTLRNMAIEKYPQLEHFTEYNLLTCETIPGEGIEVTVGKKHTIEGNGEHESHDDEDGHGHGHGHEHEDEHEDGRVLLFVGNAAMARRKGWDVENPNLNVQLTAMVESGSTFCILGDNTRALALFRLGDNIREEAAEVVRSLQAMGISISMLTGDNEGAANSVGRLVGIDDVHANLLPEDKARYLETVARPVGMVGDGVNDALSLVKADVSIGMSNGNSKIAIDKADVALMRDDLMLLLTAVKVGRTVMGKIKFNLTFSMLSKFIVVIITFTIFTSLWLAILVDVGAMLVVTLNSMSILSRKRHYAN